MAFCTNCGRELQDGFDFCPECGQQVADIFQSSDQPDISFDNFTIRTKVCKKCGDIMPEDSFYCLNCGASFDNPHDSSFVGVSTRIKNSIGTWRNKWASFFLCLFFGWLGIHKFYEGKVFMGLLYIFTLGLLGIGWFVDLVILLFKPNPYLAKRK